MRPTLVAYRPDLLGDRLLNLMHGWRLARRLDADFIHIWPQFGKWREQSSYDHPTAPLSQLFDLAEHMLARPDLRGEAWQAVHDQARALIRTLPLNARLAAAMAQVREAVDLPSAVAIHLRRGDVAGMLLDVEGKDDAFVRQFAGMFVSRYAPEQAYLADLSERPQAWSWSSPTAAGRRRRSWRRTRERRWPRPAVPPSGS